MLNLFPNRCVKPAREIALRIKNEKKTALIEVAASVMRIKYSFDKGRGWA